MNSSANGIGPRIRSFSSGKRFSHSCNASSDLKKLMTPQPPPWNAIVDAGSMLASLPFSNTAWMRAVLSGEDVSTTTLSFAYLLLTSSKESIAQLTLNLRPSASFTVWKIKSRRGSHLM